MGHRRQRIPIEGVVVVEDHPHNSRVIDLEVDPRVRRSIIQDSPAGVGAPDVARLEHAVLCGVQTPADTVDVPRLKGNEASLHTHRGQVEPTVAASLPSNANP
jgi:hypothetical protein